MFSRIKTFFSAVMCVGLLTSSMPLAARNTPVMIGGISLAGISGLCAGIMGVCSVALKYQENGLEDWVKPEDRKKSDFFTLTYADGLKKNPNQPVHDARMDEMAANIGVTRAELNELTASEYMKRFSKTQAFSQIRDAAKKYFAIATVGTIAGIAIAVKGYKGA